MEIVLFYNRHTSQTWLCASAITSSHLAEMRARPPDGTSRSRNALPTLPNRQLLFTKCIVDTLDTGHGGLPARLQLLLEKSTEAIYRAVSRGLFERHKLPFAFMICTGILRATGDVIRRRHQRRTSFFSAAMNSEDALNNYKLQLRLCQRSNRSLLGETHAATAWCRTLSSPSTRDSVAVVR